MDRIDQLNPFLGFRDGQKEAIQKIVEIAKLGYGHKVIQLDAGVGSGKSLILAIAARVLLQELELDHAIYTTPQVKLVEQIKNDKHLNIPCLVGKSNYPCTALPGFTADNCPLPKKMRKRTCSQCAYEKARDVFDRSMLGAVTLDKMLFDKSILSPDILIVDESSGLEGRLVNQSEISLPNNIGESNLEDGLRRWAEDIENELAKSEGEQFKLAVLITEGDESPGTLNKASKEGKKLRSLEQKLRKIEYLLEIISQGQKYIIDGSRKFKTLDGRRQFKKLCYGPQIVILASGTPCPQTLTAEYETVSMPNPIPDSQRLVYYDPCGKMSSAVREHTIDVMAPRIAELHKRFNRNTLVHCHSFKVAEDLGNAIADEGCRVVQMAKAQGVADKDKNKKVVRSWLAGDNTVLASVGCEEGLDCKGPKFPLNIIAVCPFPYRGDAWVTKREEEDKAANLPYNQQHGIMSTAIAIQQAVGRTTRGPEDYSETYILDENFGWFCRRYRGAFKEDFLKSIRVRA